MRVFHVFAAAFEGAKGCEPKRALHNFVKRQKGSTGCDARERGAHKMREQESRMRAGSVLLPCQGELR